MRIKVRAVNKYIKHATQYAMNLCVKLIRRLLKCSRYHWMWIIIVLFLYVVLWWHNDVQDSFINQNSRNAANDVINAYKETTTKLPRNVVNTSQSQYPILIWWNFLTHPVTGLITECPNIEQCIVYYKGHRLATDAEGAYLFYASELDFHDLPTPRNPNKIIWALTHEESPRNVPRLLREETLSLFNFSSTFSRYSDVPFPLFSMRPLDELTSNDYFVPTSLKNSHLKDIAPVMYLQSDCDTITERDAYVQELMEYIDIDSYGRCLKNKDLPDEFNKDYLNNLYEDKFLKFIARYKFIIAIENGICEDYVTEKFWRPIRVGSVPIYFGSPSIRDWFLNNKSAILLEDFPTPKLMSEHLKKLLQNDSLYEEYLEHKTKKIITNQKLIDEAKARPYQFEIQELYKTFECFVCKKLHENKVKPEVNIVKKQHYNCPEPISALSLKVNPFNLWLSHFRPVEEVEIEYGPYLHST